MKRLAAVAGLVMAWMLLANPVLGGDFPDWSRCDLKPDPGPCKALFTKYYFDAEAGKCREFIYGGCQGVVPFETLDECVSECESGDSLAVRAIYEIPGLPYGVIDLAYPREWGEIGFAFEVDGESPAYREVGGGSSPDKIYSSYMIAWGRSGKTQIRAAAVTEQGLKAEVTATLDWSPAPMMELLGRSDGDEAIMRKTGLEFYVFSADEEVEVRFNGKPAEVFSWSAADGLGSVLTVDPEWVKGRNVVELRGGEESGLARTWTFYYMPDGELGVGESVRVVYGYPGGKSGPFFDVVCESDAVELSDDREAAFYTLDSTGWLFKDSVYDIKVTGKAAGAAALKIFEKSHFAEGEKLKETINISVLDVLLQ